MTEQWRILILGITYSNLVLSHRRSKNIYWVLVCVCVCVCGLFSTWAFLFSSQQLTFIMPDWLPYLHSDGQMEPIDLNHFCQFICDTTLYFSSPFCVGWNSLGWPCTHSFSSILSHTLKEYFTMFAVTGQSVFLFIWSIFIDFLLRMITPPDNCSVFLKFFHLWLNPLCCLAISTWLRVLSLFYG